MTTKMRPIRETIPLDEARALIDAQVKPLTWTERVPLRDANGRVVARDIIAPFDVPPFSRAAMDGYAVRAEDTFGASRYEPKVLECLEQVFTGQVPSREVGAGQCTEVATGAPMPVGADAVVMVEETDKDSTGMIRIFTPVFPRQYVGRQGADLTAGQPVLTSGELLNASRVGALAAIGTTELEVYARPRVAILSTGNEIVDPGEPLAPGQIYDINKFTLTSIVAEHGGLPEPHRTVIDTIDDLSRAVDECLEADLLVFSGGSSVGERDLILDVIAQKGEVLFHGIAVKPGKPTAFGVVRGKLVFGMPGYPTSCLSNAYMLLVPVLRRMAHLPVYRLRSMTVPLGQRIVSTTGRHQFYTVRIVDGVALPAFKASGDITSMSRADGYIEIPTHTDIVEKGEIVEVKLF
ncbi:MAG TPA: gephyrin-like molybdotransferase Glp [Vicinamibacterales bacterium]|jgi:molybdenum cofactor synthesis domain-containing protein|nr:gephyrin-like molybdotransferase Glp [Vicinamibacterales bacterium]